ncbi:MAG: sulfatase-like hydrolase/transferase, partial [Acidobacteriota bacterium]
MTNGRYRKKAKSESPPAQGGKKNKPGLPRGARFVLGAIATAGLGFGIYQGLIRAIPSFGRGPSAALKKLLGPVRSSDLNVLLFTLDTTRADHLGCYGYQDISTPNIDGLAAAGILFKNATSQAPLTLPSHSSILTGAYPFSHGVRDNGGFYLEPESVTLAEVLKREGWATSAFVGAFVLDSRWGINQGFDYYYDNFDFAKYKKISLDSVQREGGQVVKAFRDWFAENHERKFFSWIHFYDPHLPYEPPEPYRSQYAGRRWGLYDGEIAYTDSLIGEVVKSLAEKDVLKRTLIVVVSDHGESLGEHHESAHGFFIYDATVLIPLIFSFPSSTAAARTVEAQVENVDLMPTVLDILGLKVPREVSGRSLLPFILGRKQAKERLGYSETYYPRYHYGWSELASLRTARYKYISAPRHELYDLKQDPSEQFNIYSREKDLAEKFAGELKTLRQRWTEAGKEDRGPGKLDDETLEKLQALGYVGGFTSSAKLGRSDNLADPKDKILLYNKIKMAEGASADREYDVALEKISEAIAEDPGIIEARQVRAQIYLRLDRPDEAIAECREALKFDPEYDAAIFTLAQAYKELRKFEDAAAGFERLIQLDPRDPRPFVNLGEIYLELKDFDQAISNLEQAISLDPEHSSQAHNLLGAAYLEKKMPEPAKREILKALEMRPRIPDAHHNLGLLYEERGMPEKAIEEYKQEIEIHPAAHPAHFNLALLYGKAGDIRSEIAHLREAIKHNPKFARAYLFLAKAYLELSENFGEAVSLAKK